MTAVLIIVKYRQQKRGFYKASLPKIIFDQVYTAKLSPQPQLLLALGLLK